MLKIYEGISGAKINIEKSEIMYIGMNEEEKIDMGLKEKKQFQNTGC